MLSIERIGTRYIHGLATTYEEAINWIYEYCRDKKCDIKLGCSSNQELDMRWNFKINIFNDKLIEEDKIK